MKKLTAFTIALFTLCIAMQAQSAEKPLPISTYMTMTLASTSADIVLLQGNGGSVAVDKDNIGLLKDFIEANVATKINVPQTATLMCLIDGREYISGSIYVGDTNGAVVFNIGGHEYVNELNEKGTRFFKNLLTQ
jgi:hypothetical protein